MTLLPPSSRAFIVCGWALVAGGAVLLIELTFTASVLRAPWYAAAQTFAGPVNVALFAVAWWFLGSMTFTSRHQTRRAMGACVALAADGVVIAVIPFVNLMETSGDGLGAAYLSSQAFSLAGALSVATGFALAARAYALRS